MSSAEERPKALANALACLSESCGQLDQLPENQALLRRAEGLSHDVSVALARARAAPPGFNTRDLRHAGIHEAVT